MTEVFEKARELGEALLKSDEYVTMKRLEDQAMRNETAARAMGMYLETRGKLEDLMRQSEPDMDELKKLSMDMEAYQEAMQNIDEVAELTRAREKFSNLVGQVNAVLRFLLTGEMSDGSDCGGNCESCSSGCRTLH